MESFADFSARNKDKDPLKVYQDYSDEVRLGLLDSGEYDDELMGEIDGQLYEQATASGIDVDPETFSRRLAADDTDLISRFSPDPTVADAARNLSVMREPRIRDLYAHAPEEYQSKLESAELAFNEAATPEARNLARKEALTSGQVPFTSFTDADGNQQLELSPSMLEVAGNDKALAALFRANPNLDRRLIPQIRDELSTPAGFEVPKFLIKRQQDFNQTLQNLSEKDPTISQDLNRLRQAYELGNEGNLDPTLASIDSTLSGLGIGGQFSPDERKNFLRDYLISTTSVPVDEANPAASLRKLSTGEVHVPLGVMLNRPLFEKTLGSVPEGQREGLAASREARINAYAPDAFAVIGQRQPEFADFYTKEKQAGASDAAVLDKWMENPENHSSLMDFAGGVGESVLEGFGGLALYPMALAGNEGARDAIAGLQESDSNRRAYARLFGKNLGAGYDMARLVAPIAADVSVSLLTAGAASGLAAGKSTIKEALKGTLRSALSSETKTLARSFAESAAARQGVDAASAPLEQVLSAAGRDIAQNFTKSATTASYLATAFNRSAGSTYVQLYSALEKQGEPPERAREIALNHGLLAGAITAAVTGGFSFLGAKGMERIYDGMTRRQLTGVFNRVRQDWNKLAPEVRAGLDVSNPEQFLNSVIRKAVTPMWQAAGRPVVEEGAEEGLDEFLQYFNQQTATGEKINIADAAKQAAYAAMLGGVMGGTVTGINSIARGDTPSPQMEQAARRQTLFDTAAKLEAASSPRTAAALRELAMQQPGAAPAPTPVVETEAPAVEEPPAPEVDPQIAAFQSELDALRSEVAPLSTPVEGETAGQRKRRTARLQRGGQRITELENLIANYDPNTIVVEPRNRPQPGTNVLPAGEEPIALGTDSIRFTQSPGVIGEIDQMPERDGENVTRWTATDGLGEAEGFVDADGTLVVSNIEAKARGTRFLDRVLAQSPSPEVSIPLQSPRMQAAVSRLVRDGVLTNASEPRGVEQYPTRFTIANYEAPPSDADTAPPVGAEIPVPSAGVLAEQDVQGRTEVGVPATQAELFTDDIFFDAPADSPLDATQARQVIDVLSDPNPVQAVSQNRELVDGYLQSKGVVTEGLSDADAAVILRGAEGEPIVKVANRQKPATPTDAVTAELNALGFSDGIATFLANVPAPLKQAAKLLTRFPAPNITLVNLPGAEFAGAFVPSTGQILINTAKRGPRGAADTVIHEMLHAATEESILNPTPEQQQVLQRLDRVRQAVQKRAGNDSPLQYAVSSLSEFVTHAFTSPEFMRQVGELTPKGQRNWAQVILDTIRDLLNGRARTDAERITDAVMKDLTSLVSMTSRMDQVAQNPAIAETRMQPAPEPEPTEEEVIADELVAEDTTPTPASVRKMAESIAPAGTDLGRIDFTQLSEDLRDVPALNAEDIVHAMVNREVATQAGEAALPDITPDEADQLYDLHRLTITGNTTAADVVPFRSDTTRLVQYLEGAVKAMWDRLKLRFDPRSAMAVDRVTREISRARDGYKIRSEVKQFDPNDPTENRAMLRMQPAEFTPIYREANAYQALPFIDSNSSADLSFTDVFFATSPELALGQGDNRGIMMVFDRSGLNASPNRRKPGTALALETGAPVELVGQNRQDEYQRALRSIEFNPKDLSDPSGRRLQMVARGLESQGWEKTTNDGRVKYTKPIVSDIRFQPAANSPTNRFTNFVFVNDGNKLYSTDPNDTETPGWFARMFTRRDDMSKARSALKVDLKAQRTVIEKKFERLNRAYAKALKKEQPDMDVVRQAVGSTAPLLTPEEEARINTEYDARLETASAIAEPLIAAARVKRDKAIRQAKSDDSRKAARDTFEEEVNKANAAQSAAINAVDEWGRNEKTTSMLEQAEELRRVQSLAMEDLRENSPLTYAWADEMRGTINEFQTLLADWYSESRPDMSATIDRSNGIYLVRSYRFHADPAMAEMILSDDQFEDLRARAIGYFGKELTKDRFETMRADPQFAHIPDSDLENEAKLDVAEQAQLLFEDYILGHENAYTAAASDTIKTEFQRFMQKKNLDPVITEILGEIDDPLFNAGRTLSAVSGIMFSQKMLAAVKKDGLESGTIVSAAEVEANPSKYRSWKPLVAADAHSQAYAPLAGYYASPDDVQAWDAAFNASRRAATDTAGKASEFVNKMILGSAGISLGVMTLGSVGYFSRNTLAAAISAASQGVNMFSAKGLKSIKASVDAAFATGKEQEFVEKLIALRVLGDGVQISYLRDFLTRYKQNPTGAMEWAAAKGMEISPEAVKVLEKGKAGWSKFVSILGQGAETTETLQNTAIYLNEVEALTESGLYDSQQAIEQEAARRVKMVVSSKSETSQAITKFSQNPISALVAPFIRYKSEMIRTVVNTYRLGYADMKLGRETGNQVMLDHGRKRLMSAAAVHAGLTVTLPLVLQQLAGISDDEDKAIRAALPSYSKNSQFWMFRLPDGQLRTLDLTFTNPFSFTFDTFTQSFRALRNGDFSEIPQIATRFALEEMAGENVVAGKVLDVNRNKDESTGMPIWLSTDGFTDKIAKGVTHVVGGSYTPATAKKLYQAYQATNRPDAGDESFFYSPLGIMVGMAAPAKPIDRKIEDLAYRAFRNLSKSNSELWQITNPLSSPRGMSESEATEIYEDRVQAGIKVWQQAYQFSEAYQRLGMSKGEVLRAMTEAGLSKERSMKAMSGWTDRPVMASDKMKDIREIDPARAEAVRRAQREQARLIDVRR